MHYVVGDVHGCYDELMEILNKIEQKDSEAKIIFVGDLIDRGTKVWDVVNWAMKNITAEGKYQTVRGNHEQMVIKWYKEFLEWWDEQKTGKSRLMPETQYDFSRWLDATDNLTPEKIEPYIHFFESMPFSKKVEIQTVYGKKVIYRIVHAWYDFNEPEESERQHHCNLWKRNYYGNHGMAEIIIHGHTPTIERGDRPGMIYYKQDSINLDGGCCYSDRFYDCPCMLSAICLESLEEIYPCTIEERFMQKQVSHNIPIDKEKAEYNAQNYIQKYMGKMSVERQNLLAEIGKI